MKLVSFRSHEKVHAGVVVGGEILNLSAARHITKFANSIPETVRGILVAGVPIATCIERLVAEIAVGDLGNALRRHGALFPLADADLAPVIPDPRLILCGSMNSRAHNAEMGAASPSMPCAFLKTSGALAASGDQIVPPVGYSEMLDWEGEFTIVIGKRCHRVQIAEALEYVFGYTLMNDV